MGNQVTIVGYDQIEWTTDLVVISCANCGVPFGMPRNLNKQRREDGSDFWCVNGHANVYRDTEADKLKRKLTAAERRADAAEATARTQRKRAVAAEGSNRALRGVVTRERKRVGRGACPCCGRFFEQLSRHMNSKHPDYAESQP